jgi:hypothetical protein
MAALGQEVVMLHPRLSKNSPGDFYTTGECLSCALPEQEAPECLAALDESNSDTYFIRQPETDKELENVCSAARVCCVSAIRYGGKDPAIIRRLGNRPEYCDHLLPGGPVRLSSESDSQWALALKENRPWWKLWLR